MEKVNFTINYLLTMRITNTNENGIFIHNIEQMCIPITLN